MYYLGRVSLENLTTVHPILQLLSHYVIREMDYSVTEGFRTKETQDHYYASGRTKPGPIITHVQWPNGNHNGIDGHHPSLAVHFRPYPFTSAREWKNLKRFYDLIGVARGIYMMLQTLKFIPEGINHISGGDWDDDHDMDDQKFNDLVHHEIRGPEELILEYVEYSLEKDSNGILRLVK